jgi:hypothetical protein
VCVCVCVCVWGGGGEGGCSRTLARRTLAAIGLQLTCTSPKPSQCGRGSLFFCHPTPSHGGVRAGAEVVCWCTCVSQDGVTKVGSCSSEVTHSQHRRWAQPNDDTDTRAPTLLSAAACTACNCASSSATRHWSASRAYIASARTVAALLATHGTNSWGYKISRSHAALDAHTSLLPRLRPWRPPPPPPCS